MERVENQTKNKKSGVGSGRGRDHEPISTLGENVLEGVCAGALDHADEHPGIEDDLFYMCSGDATKCF
jgi:hypothetical protein